MMTSLFKGGGETEAGSWSNTVAIFGVSEEGLIQGSIRMGKEKEFGKDLEVAVIGWMEEIERQRKVKDKFPT